MFALPTKPRPIIDIVKFNFRNLFPFTNYSDNLLCQQGSFESRLFESSALVAVEKKKEPES